LLLQIYAIHANVTQYSEKYIPLHVTTKTIKIRSSFLSITGLFIAVSRSVRITKLHVQRSL